MVKRKYYNNIHYVIDEEQKIVVLKPEFHAELLSFDKFKGFKKIGGSTIGDVLLTGGFKSQFSAFCHIARLKLPVLAKKYVNAGTILEPRVFDAFRNAYPNEQILNYQAHEYNYNFFEGKNDYIIGVPDGFLPSKNCVLEIKTAGESKIDKWNKEVEPSYRKQAQLYAYLMNAERYKIIALFLKEDQGDYLHPELVDLKKRKIKAYDFVVNYAEAQDDIEKVKQWFVHHTQTGVSPQYNLSIDTDQIEYLKCSTPQEWENLLNHWIKIGKADPDCQA
ncbi:MULTISPECIES: MAGa7180 family putative nuclease [unclassified Mycoplasma]|uniref:MAGa7180 family putative nuclease n=1 Tax=unclassified Mycoplasma TaxID=2683645 RepID=UPI00211CD4E9|nr:MULTISPECIES: YqaJ viral recombinase family protein [unclassified Mycoplasma]UUM20137.1 YqaJ viral recombinase family protein [Mycoplasma sp. 1578d]UUM25117.1 YqaJ viral recombinase family protein [Mycoplasma sp. 3686d]